MDALEAERLVSLIRKDAKLTPKESRYLTVKLNSPVYDFTQLPIALMQKLRETCKKLNIIYKGERF